MDLFQVLRKFPEEQRYSLLMKHLVYTTREQKKPLTAAFELTPLCNLNCKMCYVHISKEQMCSCGNGLSKEQWKQLVAEAKEMGIHCIRLTGGEALIHPDFYDIYKYIHEQGILVDVFTNGSLITEEHIGFFLDFPPRNIQVSLYGLSEIEYLQTCRVEGAFEKVAKAIDMLRRANLPFTIATTITNESSLDYLSIHQLANRLGVQHVVGVFLQEAREDNGVDVSKLRLDSRSIYDVVNKLREVDGKAPLEVCDEVEAPLSQDNPTKGFFCGGGNNTFHITWQGTMQTCPTFDVFRTYPLEVGLQEAWDKLTEMVSEVDGLVECRICPHRQYCTTCAAMHYKDTGVFGKVSPKLCFKRNIK